MVTVPDTSPSPAARSAPQGALRLFLGLAHYLRVGTLTVRLPDGGERRFGGHEPGPEAVLELHRDRVARRYLARGNLGFCESYLDGDWSSPDVEALFTLFLLNKERLQDTMLGGRWFRALQTMLHWMRPNSRRGARRNIAEHYDLGNSFFEKWLDPGMTYSSALFEPSDTDLCQAQRSKYRRVADRLELAPEDSLLEIGCGWGGFAEYAAAERGARVTAITISREQHDFALRRIFEAGLADRVEVRLQDYRDVPERFDRVASIEMLEAVGERYWPGFFAGLRDRLRGGGTAVLQVITIADRYLAEYRSCPDYIQRYIFPGGMLPSHGVLNEQLRAVGLTVREMAGFGEHYVRTLREWNSRFQGAWPDLERLGFNDRFKRMWEQYFHYCAAGFRVGTIDVVHVSAVRP